MHAYLIADDQMQKVTKHAVQGRRVADQMLIDLRAAREQASAADAASSAEAKANEALRSDLEAAGRDLAGAEDSGQRAHAAARTEIERLQQSEEALRLALADALRARGSLAEGVRRCTLAAR